MNKMVNQMNAYAAALQELAKLVLQLQQAIKQKEAGVVGEQYVTMLFMIDGIKEDD